MDKKERRNHEQYQKIRNTYAARHADAGTGKTIQ